MEAVRPISAFEHWARRWGVGTIIAIGVIAAIAYYYAIEPIKTTAVLASAVRQSTPLILGALCGMLG